MGGTVQAQARRLFQAALAIFVITIVIGVLNGLDVWDPPHELLLTHVHAGTLGWITLAVIGVAVLMYAGDDDAASARVVSWVAIGAVTVYVVTFASTTGIVRPVAGTLMLLAIGHVFAWVQARRRSAPRTVPALGLYLALISLLIGAVLGVLLGVFIANGSIPGLSTEMASNISGAHPPAMLAGYLILAGAAIAEWRLLDPPTMVSESRSGVFVVVALFVAGLVFNVAFIFEIDPLIQLASMLQVIAVITFVVRMWSTLKPSAWRGGEHDTATRWSVIFLVVGVAILVYLVQLFVSGQLDPEAGEGTHILIAFDHAFFVGMMTNVLLATTGLGVVWDRLETFVVWAINLSLLGFLVGLVAESAAIKQVSTPVLGAALLAAVFTRLFRTQPESAVA